MKVGPAQARMARHDAVAIHAMSRAGFTPAQIAARSGWGTTAVNRALRRSPDDYPIAKSAPPPEWGAIYEPQKDDGLHLRLVFAARKAGFPVAFSRPHYRVRAA